MAVPADAVPSLLQCQCQICLEILFEPVTLPCNHTVCNPCFQSTLEKANLCCPFCRRRISSWARYHTRRNSLVNMELWETIQKYYPKECELRARGQDAGEIVDDCQLDRVLSMPGELRIEYEKEVRKMEAERRAQQEEDDKASEEYVKKLLAEEEEEEKRGQAEKRKREMEEQRKRAEQLAGKLSVNVYRLCEGSYWASPSNSRKADSIIIESRKKSKSYQRNTGVIHKCLSPKYQFGSASGSEVVQEDRKSPTPKATDIIDLRNRMGQNTEIEEDMPALSPQICLRIEELGATSSVETPMPQLSTCHSEQCLEGGVKTRPNNRDKELCAVNHKEPKTRAPYSREAAVKPCGNTESGPSISGMTQVIGNSTMERENEEINLLVRTNSIFKIKTPGIYLQSSHVSMPPPKRRELFPRASSDKGEKEISFTQKLMELEHLYSERHKQEQQDRLLAMKLQKKMDKEMKPNRQKGTPNAYQLRSAPFSPDNLQKGQKKNSKDGTFKRQTHREHSKSWRSSRNENQQCSFKTKCSASINGRRMPNSARDHCNVSESIHSPQSSNS
ncbi:E3 ubiquitin-protein ligase RNF168-like [Elephas maximus indicus]|uniref:E3 ubiquitin-protein ligase RNF168-like n=1 Tax=Elephas maximus indicus TaxID=99487 RepID=UPI0021168B81|nr:E3 ubiquitin-protein ligase RNF168-like [Elephas maximus indicus]